MPDIFNAWADEGLEEPEIIVRKIRKYIILCK